MNIEKLVELQIDMYERNLLNKQHVSRFAIYPHRKELRHRLKNHPDALHELELLVESVENTI